jgi:hypothetical protein
MASFDPIIRNTIRKKQEWTTRIKRNDIHAIPTGYEITVKCTVTLEQPSHQFC